MAILRLHESIYSGSEEAGGKGANLLELIRLGMPVPGGMILSADAYEKHAARCGLREKISEPMEARDWEGVERAARELFASCLLDEDLKHDVLRHHREMGGPMVAVRSSATSEDLTDASFAGQYETFLNVQGEANLMEAIGKCWASLWKRRAIAYRSIRSMDHFSTRMAVVIQEMVPAEVSGVLFTANPVQPDGRDFIRIEAVRGLGEAVVSGIATGEVTRVRRSDLKTISQEGSRHLLTREQIEHLCSLALRIEEHFGCPQDIEFAVAGSKMHLLQARAITSFPEASLELLDPPGKPSFLDRMMKTFVDERYAVAPRPLDNLVFTRLVGGHIHAIRECGGKVTPEDQAAFDAQVWRPAYRLPPVRQLWRALLGDPIHQLRTLRTDWQAWWENGPRSSILAVSEPVDLSRLADEELFNRADAILSAWEEPLYTRLSAAAGIRAEPWLKLLVTLAVGPRKSSSMMACLLTGIDNPTLKVNEALWELSRQACRDPAVKAAVRDMVPERLHATREGREFLQAFGRFMGQYGHREGSCWYLTTPTWRQDPSQVWRILSSLVETEQRAGNPEEVRARRAAAIELIEKRSCFIPGLGRAFRWMLEHLTTLNAFREDTHFDLTRPLAALQEIAAEWGRRLADRSLLGTEDDVGYLTFDEVRDWLLGRHPSPDEALKLIARRRTTYRIVNGRWQEERFAATAPAKRLHGVGASSGVAQGRARIVRGEHEFDKVRPGDVLVSPYTMPAWTPLFATSVAVVTETGGVSSHAAIVAREYGIPAVMAVAGTTRILEDGEIILVDGSRGLITRGKGAQS
ncbi:MAG: PEP/pyruvate-binding domain-containing protein [Syntrophobacteraceae bacterium]